MALDIKTSTNGGTKSLFPSDVYETINSGRIAVIPNYLPSNDILRLREDAAYLWNDNKFSTDALAGYGSNGKFDPKKDRAVLKLNQWKDKFIGNYKVRDEFGNSIMANLRQDLAYNLDRPNLNIGQSISKYGEGSTEISYTRFGPGAYLKRHVDEHHEELKGVAGWKQPTRRSISWLIYLNDPSTWNPEANGGQLRCFERLNTNISQHNIYTQVGARPNGDLQIGWLRATPIDNVDRPVFLDSRQHYEHGKCAMYIVKGNGNNDNIDSTGSNNIEYITNVFDANPILYMNAGSEANDKLAQKLLINRADLAKRFHYIEPPKSKFGDLLASDNTSSSSTSSSSYSTLPEFDEKSLDIDPIGGTLVLFDSVSLPHEVLATIDRERWATSGWMHEVSKK